MPRWLALLIYNLTLPWFFILALPGWLVRMGRRGGFGSGLRERLGFYRRPAAEEVVGGVVVQAVSVGEVGIAMKLIRAWRELEAGRSFVLATGTATGRQLAAGIEGEGVRVVYAPFDLPGLAGRFLMRFRPGQLVLIDSEIWPNTLSAARRRGIPVRLANARLSPRSERRYRKFGAMARPVLGMLDRVGAQEPEDCERWSGIGVEPGRIELTGSVKFDPGAAKLPQKRPEFSGMIGAFGAGRPVVVAASTHAGEEEWIASALRQAEPGVLCVIVPRHAERRGEVRAELESAGFEVILRSAYRPPDEPERACLVVDSTGELSDWTAYADLVVIGKSILGRGGQSPADAILAGVPCAFGPWMTNFNPLAERMVERAACFPIDGADSLADAIRRVLVGGGEVERMTAAARELLATHEGATQRTIAMLGGGASGSENVA